VLLVGCDFSEDGTADNPTLRAVRALAADPNNPAVILLTKKGSEYTAVQAVKSGAFDYIPKSLLGREQILSAVQRAMLHRKGIAGTRDSNVAGVLRLFGYDIRRCLAHRVVLKVLHRGRGALSRDANFERFVDEFKLLYDIDDPAVAEIYDFRVTSHYCYIAMEYFALGHLGARLSGPLDVGEALGYAAEIAHALSIIHAAGIVHRDLKPGNIMVREEGTVALIDFGISHSADVNQPHDDGASPTIAGTPYYMSPEQGRGESTDERTDFYALGVVLYHMLTGDKPYVGDSTDAILEQHCQAPIPRLGPPLEALQPLLDRLLAKDQAQRLANAREVIEAIEEARAAVGSPVAAAKSAVSG
jgi:serine/threonine protein kinase